jgi:hypothetical protein
MRGLGFRLEWMLGWRPTPGKQVRIPWWWCDALFMAPTVWAQMAEATGDHKYVDYMFTRSGGDLQTSFGIKTSIFMRGMRVTRPRRRRMGSRCSGRAARAG